MNRRNFLRASASPLLAPVMAPIFNPLRAYAQEAPKGDQLIITKVEPYVMRVPAPAAGRGAGTGRGGAGAGRAAGPGGGEGGGRGYPCVRIETAEGIHGWGEGTTPPTNPAVMTQIRESGKLLMGKSAWDIEGHWTQIYTTEFNTLGGQPVLNRPLTLLTADGKVTYPKLKGGTEWCAAFTSELQAAVEGVESGKEPALLSGSLARDSQATGRPAWSVRQKRICPRRSTARLA